MFGFLDPITPCPHSAAALHYKILTVSVTLSTFEDPLPPHEFHVCVLPNGDIIDSSSSRIRYSSAKMDSGLTLLPLTMYSLAWRVHVITWVRPVVRPSVRSALG